jgi:hypothetical protein
MTDLQTLLERAVDLPADVDVAGDLRRGHRALTRRRRTVLGGSAALLVGAGTAVTTYPHVHQTQVVAADHDDAITAGAFQLPSIPDGWEVMAANVSRVVMAPAGTPKQSFDDPKAVIQVLGNLLVDYRTFRPPRDSQTLEYDGRTFYEVVEPPYPAKGYPKGTPPRQLAVRDASGHWLWLQEATRLRWSWEQMAGYLDGVVVQPDAVPDHG